MKSQMWRECHEGRRFFIGGSDARIIMGSDEAALIRLWREKRGEAEPEDLSGNLIVQLGTATEELNRFWYERNTGRRVRDVQRRVKHSAIPWMAATLDGIVEGMESVFEAKFMLPWSFSEEAAAEKHMAQLQHNMWVTASRTAVLSIITGGGKWMEMTVPADPLYQHLLLTAEKKFWRCVETGEVPRLFGVEPPRPRIEAVRTVDMSASNAWRSVLRLSLATFCSAMHLSEFPFWLLRCGPHVFQSGARVFGFLRQDLPPPAYAIAIALHEMVDPARNAARHENRDDNHQAAVQQELHLGRQPALAGINRRGAPPDLETRPYYDIAARVRALYRKVAEI